MDFSRRPFYRHMPGHFGPGALGTRSRATPADASTGHGLAGDEIVVGCLHRVTLHGHDLEHGLAVADLLLHGNHRSLRRRPSG